MIWISHASMFSQKLEESKHKKEKRGIGWTIMGPRDMIVLRIDKSFPDKVILMLPKYKDEKVSNPRPLDYLL